MSNGTIIQQGRFTSTGVAKTLILRSNVDRLEIFNSTIAAADQTTAVGVEYFWQRGFSTGAMWEYKKSNAAAAANLSVFATSGGFTLIDSSNQTPGAAVVLTAVSSASPPVVTTASTSALATGDTVRIINATGGQQLGNVPFHITVINATTFSLTYMSTIVAATTGTYRVVPFDPLFAPRYRFATAITAASSAVVTTSMLHEYVVGQKIKMVVPSAFGMTEMDGLTGTITAVSTSTFTLDIDSSAFTAFVFPLTAAATFSSALAVPAGEDTAQALLSSSNVLGGATKNTGYIGMSLANGTNSPAGVTSDVIYWVAFKSFSIDNE